MGKKLAICSIVVMVLASPVAFQISGQSRQGQRILEKAPVKVERPSLAPGSIGSSLRGDEYDVIDYHINLILTPDSTFVQGDVVFEYIAGGSGVSSVDFNLDQPLLVDSVTAPVGIYEFIHVDDVVSVFLDSTIAADDTSTIHVYYHGVPPPPTEYGTLYFSNHSGQPIIYSISWPDNARSWWPCKDDIRDKATASIVVTVPEGLIVASNGTLVDTIDNGDGTRTFTWRENYPVTTYNICIAITNYEVFLQYHEYAPADTMILPFFVFPEDRAEAEEDWNLTATMLAVYDSVFGEYPFLTEKYGMAETMTDPFAAMEHQTITSYGNFFITGDHRWDMIVAHELAHSWWGNSLTPSEWEEIWLSEGFSTYSEAVWAEYLGGMDNYLTYMGILDTRDFTGSVYDPVDLLGSTVYNKGAWVLHMLRYVVGDSAFFEILPALANDPSFKYDHVSTPDLITLSETISGMELDWFFNEWVYQEGRPNYLLTWEASDTSGTWETTVTIEQVQSSGTIFKMPLQLLFVSDTDSVEVEFVDSTAYFQDTFELPWEPVDVFLDPDGWVLKNKSKPLKITTTELDDGTVGIQYYAVLRSEGGVGQMHWSIEDGTLPDGLELNPDIGLISGIPTVADSFPFLARVTDSYDPPHYDEAWLSIVIRPSTGIDPDDRLHLPREFALQQNFPNPFNPQTVVRFSVPGRSRDELIHVLLLIYDIRGRKVKTLINTDLSPGNHSVVWDGTSESGNSVSSGVYFYILKSEERTISRKMVLAR